MIDLTKLRKAKKVNQSDIAQKLGISRQTYSLIEKGEAELSLGQAVKLADYFDIDISSLGGQDIGVESKTEIDREKYKQIITNFVKYGSDDSDDRITKTKLAKLCYLFDFSRYYNHLISPTGLEYRRLQKGPVPDAYFATIDELLEQKSIDIEKKNNGAMMIENTDIVHDDMLNKEELRLIQDIAKKRKNRNTKSIVDFTHQQMPRMMCDHKEIIPYSLITQEDPHNVY